MSVPLPSESEWSRSTIQVVLPKVGISSSAIRGPRTSEYSRRSTNRLLRKKRMPTRGDPSYARAVRSIHACPVTAHNFVHAVVRSASGSVSTGNNGGVVNINLLTKRSRFCRLRRHAERRAGMSLSTTRCRIWYCKLVGAKRRTHRGRQSCTKNSCSCELLVCTGWWRGCERLQTGHHFTY